MFYIEKESFEISDTGTITGRLSIKIDDNYFPEREWNDFVIIILNQWASELRSYILGVSTESEFLFMEGPFIVKIRSLGSHSHIMFIQKGNIITEIVMHTEKFKSEALKSILLAIDLSLQRCSESKWLNKDIIVLSAMHERVYFGSDIVIGAEGKYIYLWVSNESENTKVWFDDLRITHASTFVAQATDYGVWGDVIREQQSELLSKYRYGYQGQYAEKDEETGWNHFELREYDPVTGRWSVIDPKREFYSPY